VTRAGLPRRSFPAMPRAVRAQAGVKICRNSKPTGQRSWRTTRVPKTGLRRHRIARARGRRSSPRGARVRTAFASGVVSPLQPEIHRKADSVSSLSLHEFILNASGQNEFARRPTFFTRCIFTAKIRTEY
jgi:hypothetical protein